MVGRILLLAALTMVLAGCADSGTTVALDDVQADRPTATATTGVIVGVVVDGSIQPVVGATVALAGTALVTESLEDGSFAFGELEPGTYFLQITKPGYGSVQQSTDVLAGVEPEILKVLLEQMPGTEPFFESFKWDGFIECSIRTPALGVAVCSALPDEVKNDQFAMTYDVEATPAFAQSQIEWDSTQALGDALSFQYTKAGTGSDYVEIEGPSPLMVNAQEELLAANGVGEGDPLFIRVFTSHHAATEPPGGALWGVGLQLNQEFTVYTHLFHNFVPDEGWNFIQHGNPPVPT